MSRQNQAFQRDLSKGVHLIPQQCGNVIKTKEL
jgi:hypothetical protein